MPTTTADPLDWMILPGAALEAELLPAGTGTRIVQISGNRCGLLSLGNLLVRASSSPADHECLSLTGLSFVRVHSDLALSVVQALDEEEVSRLRRSDKGAQFEWLVSDVQLERIALGVMNVAFTPDGYLPEYYEPEIARESDAIVLFGRDRRGGAD